MAILTYSYVHKYIPRGEGDSWRIPKNMRSGKQTWYSPIVKPVETVWYRIAKFVSENDGCFRADIQEHLGRGRNSCKDVYTTMIADNIITYNRDTRVGHGHEFRYHITSRGQQKMFDAEQRAERDLRKINKSNETRFKTEKAMVQASLDKTAAQQIAKFRRKI